MSGDPAFAAARRAWDDGRGPTTLPVIDNEAPPGLVAAAREMAAPIRVKIERIEKSVADAKEHDISPSNQFYDGIRFALDYIKPLVYAEEES